MHNFEILFKKFRKRLIVLAVIIGAAMYFCRNELLEVLGI
jgi:hypothetical protein